MTSKEFEELFNDSFKEIFTKNYSWIIILLIFSILLILILFIAILRMNNKQKLLKKDFIETRQQIFKSINSMDNELNNLKKENSTSSKTKNNNSEDIIKQLDELKKILEKEND